jgi:hypothetical protein
MPKVIARFLTLAMVSALVAVPIRRLGGGMTWGAAVADWS